MSAVAGDGTSVLLGFGILEMMLRGDEQGAVEFATALSPQELTAVVLGFAAWRAGEWSDAVGADVALATLAQWRAEIITEQEQP